MAPHTWHPRRRTILQAALAATVLSRPALAETAPLRLGWLVALTGPGSSTGIGFNRGLTFAIDEVNRAGGVRGRQIEVVTRDTQGDPTKAVNASVELTRSLKVAAIWGPVNSGEALAVTPILARSRTPMIHPCFVDQLIDPEKFPQAFRLAPDNEQLGRATTKYVAEVLKVTQVALVGDATGYGTTCVNAYTPMVKQAGGTLAYSGTIEASQADLTADVTRMRDAGAKVISFWSANAGFAARLLNARGQLGWDVPVVGNPSLGTGETRALLGKAEYWDRVYQLGFRSCSAEASGKMPDRTADFLKRIEGKIKLADTSLWYVAGGYDAGHMFADAVRERGDSPDEIIGYWNTLSPYPGIWGDYRFSPQQHNGYPDDGIVLSLANSFRDGIFQIAPGFS